MVIVKIVDIGSMLLILNRVDEGFDGSGRATAALLEGNITQAWNELMQGIKVLFTTREGRKDILTALLASGAVRVVRQAGIGVPKFTVGDITFTL